MDHAVENYFPNVYRLLKLMHMDHVLKMKSKIRVILLMSCVISLVFAGVWASDIVNLNFLRRTPWTDKGIARFTFFYQGIGMLLFLWMFKNSTVALCNYDDDNEKLHEKKKRILNETKEQALSVLKRAQDKANSLCELMADLLASDIQGLVTKMKKILSEVKTNYGDEDLYEGLVVAMATHLHDLRSPAMRQFSKLIDICKGENQFLVDELTKEEHQSMIIVLTDQHGLAGRAGTVLGTTEFDLIVANLGSDFAHRVEAPSRWCGKRRKKKNALKVGLTQKEEAEILKKYRPKDRTPPVQQIVLRPVYIMLAWLGKAKAIAPDAATDNTAEDPPPEEKLSMKQWFIAGAIFCFFYLLFYAFTAKEVLILLNEGACEYNELACMTAFARKCLGLAAMAFYIFAMMEVIKNIEKIDSVIWAQEEIHDMEDFKHEIDQLNTHTFNQQEGGPDSAPRLTMLSEIAERLEKSRDIFEDHYNSAYGHQVNIDKYKDLLEKLKGRHQDVNDNEHGVHSLRSNSGTELAEQEPLVCEGRQARPGAAYARNDSPV